MKESIAILIKDAGSRSNNTFKIDMEVISEIKVTYSWAHLFRLKKLQELTQTLAGTFWTD